MIVRRQTIWGNQGFTILEIILVILIIGVIGMTVTPKWTGQSLSLQYEAVRVLNDIRFAQAMSLATGQRYRWVQISSTSYQITDESGSAIMLPNGGNTLVLTNGVTFGTFTNLPGGLIAFDSQGIPYTTSAYPGTALAATAVIPVSNSSQTQNILINPVTGSGALQ
jgi:prepilin-type N-terminal cleavage/methylation domain-containing protein